MEYLKKFDQFGVIFNQSIDKREKQFKSALGGIVTLLLYSASLTYLIYKLYLWSSGMILPKITNQITSYNYYEKPFSDINPLEIYMYLQGDDPFDQQKNYVTCFFYYQIGVDIFTEYIPIQPQQSQSQLISSTLIPKNIKLILNPQQIGNQSQKGLIAFAICDSSFKSKYNITCASEEEINEFLNKFQSFEFWVQLEIFDPQEHKISKILQEFSINLDYNAPFFIQVQYKITQLNIDDNIFFTSSRSNSIVSSYSLFTQPISQQLLKGLYPFSVLGGLQIQLDSNGSIQNVEYVKIGQMLADVGSITSSLLSLSIIVSIINNMLQDDKLSIEILSIYFPEIKKFTFQQNIFGQIKEIKYLDQQIEIQQYKIFQESLKEKILNKITVLNQIYELSRVQFLLQNLINRDKIIEAHKYGIKIPIGIQDDSDSRVLSTFELKLEDFNLLSNDFDSRIEFLKVPNGQDISVNET
ncbi:hypothetical protein pb186bvf_011884 [Paramecium bursaria]